MFSRCLVDFSDLVSCPKLSSLVFPVELDAEHAQRVPGAEQGGVPPPQVKLKERQKFFEEAFQQDMEQYLSTGYLQIAERRGETAQRWGQKFVTDALYDIETA